jgi:hypothetical protein
LLLLLLLLLVAQPDILKLLLRHGLFPLKLPLPQPLLFQAERGPRHRTREALRIEALSRREDRVNGLNYRAFGANVLIRLLSV